MTLCIIPARGGSKRIPGKNMKEFCGKPILSYPIGTAIDSGVFDDVMVSTDSPYIAGFAKDKGASIPFMRSEFASSDEADTEDVIDEVLIQYREKLCMIVTLCCVMYPTSIFCTVQNLKNAKKEAEYNNHVFSVVEFEYPLERALIETATGNMYSPANENKPSQAFKTRYHDAAQFYFFDVEFYMSGRKRGLGLLEMGGKPVLFKRSEVQDINTFDDWDIAELKWRRKFSEIKQGVV